jgi:hypothetical protein
MQIKNKKSILATLDEIIGNSKYKTDGISEERTSVLNPVPIRVGLNK